jgi:hypothetical protein
MTLTAALRQLGSLEPRAGEDHAAVVLDDNARSSTAPTASTALGAACEAMEI